MGADSEPATERVELGLETEYGTRLSKRSGLDLPAHSSVQVRCPNEAAVEPTCGREADATAEIEPARERSLCNRRVRRPLNALSRESAPGEIRGSTVEPEPERRARSDGLRVADFGTKRESSIARAPTLVTRSGEVNAAREPIAYGRSERVSQADSVAGVPDRGASLAEDAGGVGISSLGSGGERCRSQEEEAE